MIYVLAALLPPLGLLLNGQPFSAVFNMQEAFSQPHFKKRELLQSVEHVSEALRLVIVARERRLSGVTGDALGEAARVALLDGQPPVPDGDRLGLGANPAAGLAALACAVAVYPLRVTNLKSNFPERNERRRRNGRQRLPGQQRRVLRHQPGRHLLL